VSTTPNSGLDVRSVWLWPQLGQYWEVSGTSELQYQQVVTGGNSRRLTPQIAPAKPTRCPELPSSSVGLRENQA
jgi:hypothetical protein